MPINKGRLTKEDVKNILEDAEKWPDTLLCPITQELIKEPVMCQDGYMYEKNAIEKWLQSNNTSPLTRQKITTKEVFPVHFVRQQIKDIKANKINNLLEYTPIFLNNRYINEARELLSFSKDYFSTLPNEVKKTVANLDWEVQKAVSKLSNLTEGDYREVKITLINEEVHEGRFGYIPELKDVRIIQGKITWPDKEVHDGKFGYIPELENVKLIQGKITWPSKEVHDGKFGYIPELKDVGIIKGTVTFPDGQVHKGKFVYIPELKDVGIIEGTITWPDGDAHKGTFGYIPELKAVGIIEGTIAFSNGHVLEGKFGYIHKLENFGMIEGTITFPDGKVVEKNKDDRLEEMKKKLAEKESNKGLFMSL